MLKLSSKSLISCCKKSAAKFAGLKLVNRASHCFPKNSNKFFSTRVPRGDNEDTIVDRYNKNALNEIATVGLGVIGGLCLTGGLIHLDCLHRAVLLFGGWVSLCFTAQHDIQDKGKENNLAGYLTLSLWSTLCWNVMDKGVLDGSHLELFPFFTYFPSTLLLSTVVFGSAALYAKYASQVSIYRPALVGTLAGVSLIAAEHSLIGSTFLSDLYKPEQQQAIYLCMCNMLPFLTFAAIGGTRSALPYNWEPVRRSRS